MEDKKLEKCMKFNILEGIKALREKQPNMRRAEFSFFAIAGLLGIKVAKELDE